MLTEIRNKYTFIVLSYSGLIHQFSTQEQTHNISRFYDAIWILISWKDVADSFFADKGSNISMFIQVYQTLPLTYLSRTQTIKFIYLIES